MYAIGKFGFLASLTILSIFIATSAMAAPQCYVSYGGTKPNKLYLYFPTADDSSYPEFGITGSTPPTSPAHAFNISDLTSYTGTVDDLRNAIYDVVADDYCEFNVEVIQTTTVPPTTFPRRNTVSIGTDDGTSYGGLFGLAQNVDTGDATAVDFAHEWAGTYQGMYGGVGGALNGTNSTLERWARAIGGTAAHEAGHNYGLSHNDGLPLAAGEDPLVHHLMASGSHYNGEDRAAYRRHFSDHEYAVLASNVGFSVQTVWNWDFVNPNAQTATKVQMDFLSTQASLAVTGPYNGNESPWVNPTVSGPLGTQTFKGVSYYHYQVIWSTGHSWDGHVPGGPGPSSGVSGQVAGGASFHVGTGFSGVNYNLPDPIIITNVTLFDAANTALALHPRAIAFDSGALDAADGTFKVQAINFAAPLLKLNSVSVQLLPRLLNINDMVGNGKVLRDVRNVPFSPLGKAKIIKIGRSLEKGQTLAIPIARLSDKRYVIEKFTEEDCKREDRLSGPDVAKCKPGINVSLFPATTVYLTASATDPLAKHWDFKEKRYVKGPVTSHVFLQIPGFHPDLNKNGVDDYIDILKGTSKDTKRIGVPDDAPTR
jgi:hypothetical protein